jgi:hypothetical protein
VGHLVKPISQRTTIADCFGLVKEAHDYLSRQGMKAVERAQRIQGSPYWGSEIKRISVVLPDKGRPDLVPPLVKEHSLTEVYNQCATMERLLDVLQWTQTNESQLSHFVVERCHPTTSSAPEVVDDHDLVLVGPSEVKAKFEVSDVTSERDGNRKEEKDLTSLGVLPARRPREGLSGRWPSGRLFLAVSEEFARRLQKPTRSWLKGKHPHCYYLEVKLWGSTRVFEVKRGRREP